jgi:transcriptional regulator with XRE-family HTH domain
VAARKRRPERAKQYDDPVYRALLTSLAENLRSLRAERGWTQEEAADRCSMTTRYFQALEGSEKNFTATTVARLSRGFGVDADALLRKVRPSKKPRTAK